MDLLKRDFTLSEIMNFILLSVIAIMPFIVIKGDKMPFMTGKVIFLYIVGIICLIPLLKDIKNFKFIKEEILLGIFFISLIISTIFGIDPVTSLFGAEGWNQGLLMYGGYIILFFTAKKYFSLDEGKINIICAVASVMGAYTILQYYGIDLIFKYYLKLNVKVDTIATIGNRNFVATYIVIFLLISVSMYIFNEKKAYLIYSCILFGALLATLTRGGWVGLAVALLFGAFLVIKEKKYYKKIITIVLLFCGIFFVMNITRDNMLISRSKSIIEDASDIKDGGGSGRIRIWKGTINCIKKNPFYGSGIDSLKLNAVLNGIDNDMRYPKAHNEFLEYWLWGGIVTLITYVLLIGMILWKLYKIRSNNIAKIFMVVIIGYQVQSFFNISVLEVAPIYWILLGSAVKFYRDNKNL
ncbi:O-antigen ligase family protein [Clostridium sp. LP20]|uniref:O-antigen ligase family protein n=1 Tax=Clostridium sp. LP20 TaxID=3418665 RepID=UPI003EE52B67